MGSVWFENIEPKLRGFFCSLAGLIYVALNYGVYSVFANKEPESFGAAAEGEAGVDILLPNMLGPEPNRGLWLVEAEGNIEAGDCLTGSAAFC